jgi:hypothetical protein
MTENLHERVDDHVTLLCIFQHVCVAFGNILNMWG